MRKAFVLVVVLILSSFSIKGNTFENFSTFNILEEDNPIETYALLFDQFPVVVGNETFCSAVEFKESLLTLGWLEENISLFLGDDNITEVMIRNQLDYLEENVDNNDLVLIFLTAHGHP
ncbi:MAG: hypothetical protein ACXABK_03820, partial [Candidatus Heimdallarchaeaceae archaeon]